MTITEILLFIIGKIDKEWCIFTNFAIMNRLLLISDLDGTLLGPDSKVSARSAEIISELSREGALISVATARTPATVEPLLSQTLTTPAAIVMTGAALWDRRNQRYLDAVYIPADEISELLEAFSEAGVSPFVYRLADSGEMEVFHAREMNSAEKAFYEERKSLKLKRFVLHADFKPMSVPHENVILLYATGSVPAIEALARRLSLNPALSVSCYRDIFNPATANIEVFGSGVSKAKAIRRLAGMLDVDRIIAYGDNLNDLPMFEIVDESIAVENALPEVKAAASRIIGPNSADAVALDMARIIREK